METTTKRTHPMVTVCLFRSGIRDGIDCPDLAPSVWTRSHRAGRAIGRTVCRLSRKG
jgi:hypothetical protein